MIAAAGESTMDDPRTPLRVVYADNDPLALGAVESLLHDVESLTLETVSGEGSDLAAALRCAPRPCVAVLDLFLQPGGPDGIELARSLLRSAHDVPVAICTVSEEPVDAARAWAAGVRAFLTKRRLLQHRHDLGILLWNVWRGDVIYHVDPRADTALTVLSQREIEVLQHKLDGKPHREIADELCLSIRTIDSHLANARSKLSAHSVAHAMEIAVELGLIRRAG